MSETSPMRPSGVALPMAFSWSFERTATTRSDAVVPGASALTLTPCGPSSSASTRVSEWTPALAAAYGGDVPGSSVTPAIEPVSTMPPLCWPFKTGIAAGAHDDLPREVELRLAHWVLSLWGHKPT